MKAGIVVPHGTQSPNVSVRIPPCRPRPRGHRRLQRTPDPLSLNRFCVERFRSKPTAMNVVPIGRPIGGRYRVRDTVSHEKKGRDRSSQKRSQHVSVSFIGNSRPNGLNRSSKPRQYRSILLKHGNVYSKFNSPPSPREPTDASVHGWPVISHGQAHRNTVMVCLRSGYFYQRSLYCVWLSMRHLYV